MLITYRYRVKSHIGWLNEQAKKVNFVWNFCNETQKTSYLRGENKRFSGFDLGYLAAGSSKLLSLDSQSIALICKKYSASKKKHYRPYLRWRTDKNLGWLPIASQSIKYLDGKFLFAKKFFRVFLSRPLPEGKIRDGSNFSRDSLGRWYLNLVLEVPDAPKKDSGEEIAIDLGIGTFATLSNGVKITNPRPYKKYRNKLNKARLAKKGNRIRKLHEKIKNIRKDFHHKISTQLVTSYSSILIGDVSSSRLCKTFLSKHVNDAGWFSFKRMLMYKSVMNGVSYQEVNEKYSTQICSSCGDNPSSSPRGIANLGIREWVCSSCGEVHDRDINAAKNILRFGQESPVVGNL